MERIAEHVPFAQIIYFFIIKSISTSKSLPGNSHSIVRNINTAILLYFFIGLILWHFCPTVCCICNNCREHKFLSLFFDVGLSLYRLHLHMNIFSFFFSLNCILKNYSCFLDGFSKLTKTFYFQNDNSSLSLLFPPISSLLTFEKMLLSIGYLEVFSDVISQGCCRKYWQIISLS